MTNIYTINVYRSKSPNNNLSNLVVKSEDNSYTYNLTPQFNPKTMEYSIEVDSNVDAVSIECTPEEAEGSCRANHYNYLQDGDNLADVTVWAPDGTINTYYIHIIRIPEENSYIKNITVSTGKIWDLTPVYRQTTYKYTTKITDGSEYIEIDAVPSTTSTVISGTGEFKIVTGYNEFKLVATAIDGTATTYTIGVIKEIDRNVDLDSLSIDEAELNPGFDSTINKYNLEVDSSVNQLTIHAVPKDPKAQVIITGNKNLLRGENIVNVVVLSADKSASKTYKLTVNKLADINGFLNSITVTSGDINYDLTPIYDKEINNYVVYVPASVTKVTLDAEAESSTAIITGLGDEYVEFKDNIYNIVVTSESGNINTYEVNVYKQYDLTLKSLTVTDAANDEELELNTIFDSNINEYTIDVPYTVDKVNIDAILNASNVTLTGKGEYELVSGENTIEVKVQGEDSTVNTYTIKINKEVSYNNFLKSLSVEESPLDKEFINTTSSYTVTVPYGTTELTISAEPENKTSTIEIFRNNDLLTGENHIQLIVTAENGSTRRYYITAIVQERNYYSNKLSSLTIDGGQISPDFDSDKNYYVAYVNNSVSTTTISAVPEDAFASVTGEGTKALSVGRNSFYITVASRDNVPKINTYTLVIYRKDANDASLQSLTIKNHKFVFNRTTYSYDISVDTSELPLDISAITADENATYEIIGNDTYAIGDNRVDVIVTAADKETTQVYSLNVNVGKSANTYLSELSVSDHELSPQYVKGFIGPYTTTVENAYNSVYITAVPEVESSIVSGAGVRKLDIDDNTIEVSVTSESGDVRVYTIVITRERNNDTSLSDILLSDGELDNEFTSNITEYTVIIPEELNEITVTGIKNNNVQTVNGNGIYKLHNKSTDITLNVVAENGDTRDYVIHVIKDMSSNSKIASLVISEGELDPEFSKNTITYSVKVPYETTSLDFGGLDQIILEDDGASYEIIGNEDFEIGGNTVQIVVTSRDGSTTTTYVITVIRQERASNYLTMLRVDGYNLTPGYEKTNLFYSVDVPNNVEQVNIITILEDESATIDYNPVVDLDYGENTEYITVTSSGGAIRTYTLKINRIKSSENELTSLTTNVGEFDKEFDPSENEYTITVPEGTKKINLAGTISANAQVIGLGTHDIGIGDNHIDVVVTSQSGEINIYSINVYRPANNNLNLTSLIPSAGVLNYNNEIEEYNMEVNDNVTTIFFTAVPEDSMTKVSGTETQYLRYGLNTIYITVAAEDGSNRVIEVNITRTKDLSTIFVKDEELIISQGQTVKEEYTLDPEDTTYPEVIWSSLNERVATVDQEGNITGVGVGYAVIKVQSVVDEFIFDTVTVNVMNNVIKSGVYDINREVEDYEYIIGIEPNTSIEDFVSNLDNTPSTIHIFDQDDNEITSLKNYVGSYMKVKLIIRDVVMDELTIIVRGDSSGDGYVSAVDIADIINMILNGNEDMFLGLIHDYNKDNNITAIDYSIIVDYIINGINNLNQ